MSDSGLAFPRGISQTDGMTLRDYFAAKAMQGCLASCPAGIAWHEKDGLPLKEWADTSYRMADAMLKEREN